MIAILVDLDGVLWFSEKAHKDSFVEAFKLFTDDADSIITNTWSFGESTENYSRRLLNIIGMGSDQQALNSLVERKRVVANSIRDIPINYELLSALGKIKSSDILVALVSSSSKINVNKFIEISQSAHIFDCVVDGSHAENPKPRPDCYVYAMSKLVVSPLNCIAIEDSDVGQIAARDAGISLVLKYPASFEVITIEKLLRSMTQKLVG